MPAHRRGKDFLTEKVFHNGQAEVLAITHDWEIRRDLVEQSVRDIYDKLMGELLELITAISTGKSPEYALIELADVLAYAFKYPGIFLSKQGRTIHREVKTTRPQFDALLSQALLAAPVTPVPLKNSGSIDGVVQLAKFITQANGAMTGIRVNKQRLNSAISQMTTILGREQNYHLSADGSRELNKTAEKEILKLFHACFEQPLNGHLNMPNAADVIPEVFKTLEEISLSMYDYPDLEVLAASFYYDDPDQRIIGKNALNYPAQLQRVVLDDGQIVYRPLAVTHSKKDTRDIRDQFPLSIIPRDFVLGGLETPAQYLARKYPGKTRAEIAKIVAKEQIIPVRTNGSLAAMEQRVLVPALR